MLIQQNLWWEATLIWGKATLTRGNLRKLFPRFTLHMFKEISSSPETTPHSFKTASGWLSLRVIFHQGFHCYHRLKESSGEGRMPQNTGVWSVGSVWIKLKTGQSIKAQCKTFPKDRHTYKMFHFVNPFCAPVCWQHEYGSSKRN